MPNKRDLILDEYNISQYLYRELYSFCRQYSDKSDELHDLRSGISAQRLTGMPTGSDVSNPTERRAIRVAMLSRDTEAIEQCAIAAAGADLYPYLLQNVVDGTGAYSMGLSRHKHDRFYKARRYFFYLLARKLNKI